jgi:hypothetical protein
MGRTNIRSGGELFKYYDRGVASEICCIPDAFNQGSGHQLVLLTSGACRQQDLDMYCELFSRSRHSTGCWLTLVPGLMLGSRNYRSASAPPPPSKVPRVHSTPALEPSDEMLSLGLEPLDSSDRSKWKAELRYIAVIAGNLGDAVIKLVTADSTDKLACLVLVEVLNGYSAGFTGGCFESEWAKRHDEPLWQQVKTLEALQEVRMNAQNAERATVGIWC